MHVSCRAIDIKAFTNVVEVMLYVASMLAAMPSETLLAQPILVYFPWYKRSHIPLLMYGQV